MVNSTARTDSTARTTDPTPRGDGLDAVTTRWAARDTASAHGRLRDALLSWRTSLPPSFSAPPPGQPGEHVRLVVAPAAPGAPEDALLLHLNADEVERLIERLGRGTRVP
ncbi:hypothetical protein DEJ49_01235 [Streptomyces venezuelae]|uniref:Uncharacterized protein n=1 Tax=Streptomyces venezuelae TaxID=54571 RepID=A0A5P2CDA6_STRVZ|nr:hypothetical protein [Streptomyces venezuelae]QES39778.1 hypothetical protein DEJ49_01235 [Streptomyces venezuelae]